jgi:Zn ribbon nucleic-acid-binding protein
MKKPKRKCAPVSTYIYECNIHNFKTKSLRLWHKHQANTKLKHRLEGAIQCPNCKNEIELINYPVAKLDNVVCRYCGHGFDYRKKFLEMPEGKVITSDQLIEIINKKKHISPEEFEKEVMRVGVDIQ